MLANLAQRRKLMLISYLRVQLGLHISVGNQPKMVQKSCNWARPQFGSHSVFYVQTEQRRLKMKLWVCVTQWCSVHRVSDRKDRKDNIVCLGLYFFYCIFTKSRTIWTQTWFIIFIPTCLVHAGIVGDRKKMFSLIFDAFGCSCGLPLCFSALHIQHFSFWVSGFGKVEEFNTPILNFLRFSYQIFRSCKHTAAAFESNPTLLDGGRSKEGLSKGSILMLWVSGRNQTSPLQPKSLAFILRINFVKSR